MSAYTEYVEGKVITSVEQLKRLIDLGIHACSASLFLTKDIETGKEKKLVDRLYANEKSIPMWTLDDLIQMLPDKLDWNQLPPTLDIFTSYILGINKKSISYRCENDGKYRVYKEVDKDETLMDAIIGLIEITKTEKLNSLFTNIKYGKIRYE